MGPGPTDSINSDAPSDFPNAGDVNFDSLFEALSHPLRRRLLANLGDSESVDPITLLPDDADENVEAELRHVHLPKLDEFGYVDWDQETNHISPGLNYSVAKWVLDTIPIET